jgi:hypothetical protein
MCTCTPHLWKLRDRRARCSTSSRIHCLP